MTERAISFAVGLLARLLYGCSVKVPTVATVAT